MLIDSDAHYDQKQAQELEYWQKRFEAEGGRLQNGWYERRMLAMAGETDAEFVKDKIIADFGCGPRGSLCWAGGARSRIGIDVLADAYGRFGIRDQHMIYVRSTEDMIPLPSSYLDVLFTMNALDHVTDLPAICHEVIRIIAPGGLLVGSFNLFEPATTCEPQTLTPELLDELLLRHFVIEHQRVRPKGRGVATYHYFETDDPGPTDGPQIIWVRARRTQ